MERFTIAVLLKMSKLIRRGFTWLAQRGIVAQLLLHEAGIEAERLAQKAEASPSEYCPQSAESVPGFSR